MLPIQKKLIGMNYTKDVKIQAKYIVVHETANEAVGANALSHYKFWNTNVKANSSVHFVVDDKNIIQLAELDWRCWHVGDNKNGYSDITNSNAIGIEICVNADGDYNKARQNAIDLVRYLMKVTGLPVSAVKRHKDASGKTCPARMIANPALWTDFIAQVQQPEGVVVQAPKPTGNAKIKEVQQKLNTLKIVGANGKPLEVDGLNGTNTKYAVSEFQHIVGITVDGSAGSQTMDAINHILSKPQLGLPYKDVLATRYLQYRLSISIDGSFGNITASAVKKYQKLVGLVADGLVGKITWGKLIG